MATCTVSGLLQKLDGTPLEGVTIRARIVTSYFTTTIMVSPQEVFTETASDGTWSLNLERLSSPIITVEYFPTDTSSARKLEYAVTVPNAASANFSTIATEL